MKIAAHITFFYDDKRLDYLKEVVKNLLDLNHEVDIFIYTNKEFDIFPNNNIKYYVYQYTSNGFRFSYKSIFNKLGWKQMIHPFYLTWECRNIIENLVEQYDIQLYLEDDIKFTKSNLDYWLKYSNPLIKEGYNLGFLRIEYDNKQPYITDLSQPLTDIISIDNKKYFINNINPYCGFWIYSKEELKKFIQSKVWNFGIKKYGKRERSAIGWHGVGMTKYKNTLIPIEEENNQYLTIKDCAIHHLPNNYIHHGTFCTIKFPINRSKEKST